MIRTIKTIGFAIAILSLTLTNCFAAPNNNIKQTIDNESINVSLDKNDILTASNNHLNDIKKLLKESNNVDVKGIKKDSFIKAYRLNTADIVSSYKKEQSFDKLISNQYTWMMPIIDVNDKHLSVLTMEKGITVKEFSKLPLKYNSQSDKEETLAKVKENEGKWIVSKIGEDLSEDQIAFLLDSSKIQKLLLDNNISNTSKIKFVLAESHLTNILYIKRGNDEYGVPFSVRPEFSGLENGKLYSMTDIISHLNVISDVNSNGGTSSIHSSKNLILAVTISLIFLVSVFSYVFFKKLRTVR